ncbi:phosphohydrolase [Pedobacter yulinensis]|uniref:Phosphohydrolase n=1 Tax=Pedobacter yulinensis TaxID=2126353 RepID=A0A2T3HKR0_9SPHI|nr:Pycsar system effector family protein [Pedobacter yulinensis]PST83010.1 phosphohydrolase [Pedobacter yulinensis]
MNYPELLEGIRQEIAGRFAVAASSDLVYHNLSHTEAVVHYAAEMAVHYKLNDRDFFVVLAAAWFHDVGYLTNSADHELQGAADATAYLQAMQVPTETADAVKNCILATQIPQKPQNLCEEILCDADLFHLGTEDFRARNKLMRKEAGRCSGKDIDKETWRSKTIALLENHRYHTAYAREKLDAMKAKNLDRLRAKGSENIEAVAIETPVTAPVQESPGKKARSDRPERGIETMFRISSGNHQRLSDMADNKAHIMISTTSIILSIVLSILLRKIEDEPQFMIPTLLLLLICVTTMVFSILATRPSLPGGVFGQEDIDQKRVNLLFFGNFYRMSLDDYSAGMHKMMESKEFLYGSLIRDVYSQGVVLGHKYRYLRIAYNVFMFGIVAAVLAFIIAAFAEY